MGILDTMTQRLARRTQSLSRMLGAGPTLKLEEMSPREVCEVMEAYYLANGVYENESIARAAAGLSTPPMRPLRNVVAAAVNVYPNLLWPGTLPDALPIETDNPNLKAAVQQIWAASNWGVQKDVIATNLPLHGDIFIKAAVRRMDPNDPESAAKSVYLQYVSSKNVTDFDLDERGFVTYLRYDAGQIERKADGKVSTSTHTEVWDSSGYRAWKHKRGYKATASELGTPDQALSFTDMGVDFIPWVHAPFTPFDDAATGSSRGLPLVWVALTKADNLNLQATSLDRLLFNHGGPKWLATANQVGGDGRPAPPPVIGDGSTVELDGERIISLPGNQQLTSIIPDIKFQAHIDEMREGYESLCLDLPELRYYEAIEKANASGRALRLMLEPCMGRMKRARGNGETAMIRAQQMALTIGKRAGLFDDSIGDYGSKNPKTSFVHRFKEREIIPDSATDRAEEITKLTQAGMPIATAMREVYGWSQEKINDMRVDQAVDEAARNEMGSGNIIV